MNSIQTQPSVAAQVAGLPQLPMKELWSFWDKYFDRRPPHTNREYLESRLAYKIQEEAYGGLTTEVKKRLIAIGVKHSRIKPRRKVQEIYFAPGTVLVREWGQRDHQVTVTASGLFEYEGRAFKSLSAVARHITGTQWNGLLFFGLRKNGEVVR